MACLHIGGETELFYRCDEWSPWCSLLLPLLPTSSLAPPLVPLQLSWTMCFLASFVYDGPRCLEGMVACYTQSFSLSLSLSLSRSLSLPPSLFLFWNEALST
jgi:hypothetical protein